MLGPAAADWSLTGAVAASGWTAFWANPPAGCWAVAPDVAAGAWAIAAGVRPAAANAIAHPISLIRTPDVPGNGNAGAHPDCRLYRRGFREPQAPVPRCNRQLLKPGSPPL